VVHISEKGNGEYKLPVSSGDEVWEVCAWPQADSEVIEARQSEACHYS